jgi:hypothetical protein
MFTKEYKWTGIFTNRDILQFTLDARQLAIDRGEKFMVSVEHPSCCQRFFRHEELAQEFIGNLSTSDKFILSKLDEENKEWKQILISPQPTE